VTAVRIAGTGSYAPAKVLTNDDLSRMVDTSDAWITERTGIKQRRIAAENEAPSDLGVIAAQRALETAGIAPADVDMILCATSFPDHLFPTTACAIQARLGASRAGAVDLLAACSGFVYALVTGWHYAASGRYRNILAVGTETLSKIVNWEDRSTCVLFGDAAGAVVLQPDPSGRSDILYATLGADGTQGELIILPAGGARCPISPEHIAAHRHQIHMRGRDVYVFAVRKMADLTREAMEAMGIGPDGLGLLIPHQVNLRIIESAIERLNIPREKVMVNIDRYGNTSSASVPVALDEAVRAGRIRRGDAVVIVAFGGGLTWGAVGLRY
jgi:3-oxoacyl-[acyl-carrier-protein] synthase-3